jgi:hypothetical protein
MKTSVLMNRQMGDFDVYQRTSDGYFDANALLRQWNSVEENPRREMKKFLDNKNTKEFIEVLTIEESAYRKNATIDFQAVIISKGRLTSRGFTQDKVYMHPYLFIKFALWLNPKFEYQVIKFVYDELIKNRHLAGDNHNKLMSSIQMLGYIDYAHICKGLNYIVFNNHYKNIRNDATEEQLSELHILEDKLSFAIEMGYIRSYQELIENMREIYNRKNTKF